MSDILEVLRQTADAYRARYERPESHTLYVTPRVATAMLVDLSTELGRRATFEDLERYALDHFGFDVRFKLYSRLTWRQRLTTRRAGRKATR